MCWGLEGARSGSSSSQTGAGCLACRREAVAGPGGGTKSRTPWIPQLGSLCPGADGGSTCGLVLQPVRVIKVWISHPVIKSQEGFNVHKMCPTMVKLWDLHPVVKSQGNNCYKEISHTIATGHIVTSAGQFPLGGGTPSPGTSGEKLHHSRERVVLTKPNALGSYQCTSVYVAEATWGIRLGK